MKKYEIYKCNSCGNQVEVQNVGNGKLSCCNKEMECVTENLTEINLMKAFAGESQARNKYEFAAEYAKEMGYHRIAEHFQSAADNEKYHAKREFELFYKLQDKEELTIEDFLNIAIEGENYEHSEMYPEFEAIAREEGYKEIARIFKAIGNVEIEHEREFKELKEAFKEDLFLESEEEEIWVCEVCGHIHRGKKPPKKCPLCKVDKEFFKKESLY